LGGAAAALFQTSGPRWPAPLNDEASPWQWWDPDSPLAQAEVAPDITTHMASLSSNPDMSPEKARAYIDTVMGYTTPRMCAVLNLAENCGPLAIAGSDDLAAGVEVFPNPANDRVTIHSSHGRIERIELMDINGRLVRGERVESDRHVLERKGLEAGVYLVVMRFRDATVTRKLILE
jgi:hypothetical protein